MLEAQRASFRFKASDMFSEVSPLAYRAQDKEGYLQLQKLGNVTMEHAW